MLGRLTLCLLSLTLLPFLLSPFFISSLPFPPLSEYADETFMDPDAYPEDTDFMEMGGNDNLFDALVKDGAKLYIKDQATNEIMKVSVCGPGGGRGTVVGSGCWRWVLSDSFCVAFSVFMTFFCSLLPQPFDHEHFVDTKSRIMNRRHRIVEDKSYLQIHMDNDDLLFALWRPGGLMFAKM